MEQRIILSIHIRTMPFVHMEIHDQQRKASKTYIFNCIHLCRKKQNETHLIAEQWNMCPLTYGCQVQHLQMIYIYFNSKHMQLKKMFYYSINYFCFYMY
ncbi:hypothetical protein FKM82_006746 [Ascaphus truei]